MLLLLRRWPNRFYSLLHVPRVLFPAPSRSSIGSVSTSERCHSRAWSASIGTLWMAGRGNGYSVWITTATASGGSSSPIRHHSQQLVRRNWQRTRVEPMGTEDAVAAPSSSVSFWIDPLTRDSTSIPSVRVCRLGDRERKYQWILQYTRCSHVLFNSSVSGSMLPGSPLSPRNGGAHSLLSLLLFQFVRVTLFCCVVPMCPCQSNSVRSRDHVPRHARSVRCAVTAWQTHTMPVQHALWMHWNNGVGGRVHATSPR